MFRPTEYCLEFINFQFFILFFVFVKYAAKHNKLMNAYSIMKITWSFSKFLKIDNHLQKKYVCGVKMSKQAQRIYINLRKSVKMNGPTG